MSKNFFPLNINGGNRGCEAIAKGTIKILDSTRNENIGFSNNITLDSYLGLDHIEKLIFRPTHPAFIVRVLNKINYGLTRNEKKYQYLNYKGIFVPFLKNISSSDFCFITGGDMLCYDDNEVNFISDYLYKRHRNKIFWGCSVGRENLTPNKIRAISEMNLVTARESITYDLIKNTLNHPNVYCFPDPAFVLEPEKVDLTSYVSKGSTIGLNLSNFVIKNDSAVYLTSVYKFIDYIISDTDLSIVLIPHTFWEGQDDRIVCEKVKEHYQDSDRVRYYNTEKLNYCQIRYLISKCRFFIGARTHSVISAYSTCVPTLALGYSVKSIGIAKDLGLPSELVMDTRNLTNEDELLERFEYLYKHEDKIRGHLEDVMPSYMARAWQAKDALKTIE